MQIANYIPAFQDFTKNFPSDWEILFLTDNDNNEFFHFGVKNKGVFVSVSLRNHMSIPAWFIGPRKKLTTLSIFETNKLVEEIQKHIDRHLSETKK